MIRGKFLTSAEDLHQVLDVRARVCRAEGRLSGSDEHDKMAVYALVYDDEDIPSGSGRLYLDEDRFMIGCVSVLPEARGKGLGDLLMRMLLFRAQELNAPDVYALVRKGDEPFFTRYGFKPVGEGSDAWGQPCALLHVKADEIVENDCHGCKA
jgi:N-acetylglutamate synthase-like GNAT family acetyltransferase